MSVSDNVTAKVIAKASVMRDLDYEKKSDTELVELTLKDPNSYKYIISRYEAKLMHYIRRITNVEKETAEDILQEVFLKVYKNLREYDDDFKFSSWVYRITHNEAISFFRKQKARPEVVDLENNDEIDILGSLPADTNLRDDYVKKELAHKVKDIIAVMPENYRNALVLRYMEDKSYEEMADILQKPTGTVATLINRAKVEFKKLAEKNHLNKP
jgi:RNA polymerase sigma-70 factor, ECF subfamily